MVVFLVSAQERRVGSWWTWCAWRTVSSLSIGTSFRTKPREPPRKAGFRCSETSSLTNEQTAPEPRAGDHGRRRRVLDSEHSAQRGARGDEIRLEIGEFSRTDRRLFAPDRVGFFEVRQRLARTPIQPEH